MPSSGRAGARRRSSRPRFAAATLLTPSGSRACLASIPPRIQPSRSALLSPTSLSCAANADADAAGAIRLTPEQAHIILSQFDKSTAKQLAVCRVKAALEGDLHTYRSYDEVYTLVVQNAKVTLSRLGSKAPAQQERVSVQTDALKLIFQDAKVGQRMQAPQD